MIVPIMGEGQIQILESRDLVHKLDDELKDKQHKFVENQSWKNAVTRIRAMIDNRKQ